MQATGMTTTACMRGNGVSGSDAGWGQTSAGNPRRPDTPSLR